MTRETPHNHYYIFFLNKKFNIVEVDCDGHPGDPGYVLIKY